ncbi:hypothetical protein, partial [uncultured Aureimonas sp.]|uniref:hypothetical protein n=1 Tax=uncultured Aureimonas sp. TaxID=1604662 RepID=UPI0025EEA8E1
MNDLGREVMKVRGDDIRERDALGTQRCVSGPFDQSGKAPGGLSADGVPDMAGDETEIGRRHAFTIRHHSVGLGRRLEPS